MQSGATCSEVGNTATCPAPLGLPFGFHGAFKSPGTGLLYFRNRWYSAVSGEWLSQDPLGPVDSHNLYAFNGFDSVNFIDPFGLDSKGPGKGELKRVAAFTLALSTALGDDLAAAQKMVPLSSLSLLHGVSHALGYLLGDALAQAYARKAISAAEVRQLFRDPFDQPDLQFAALARRLELFSAPATKVAVAG